MLKLKQALDDKSILEIQKMMNEEPSISKIFKNRFDRLATSLVSCLIINEEDEIIGFFNLVEEKHNQDFYFLDMGIKTEYQGKGYAKEINERIVNLKGIDRSIIVETQTSNIKAIKSLSNGKTAIKLFEQNDSAYFLLDKNQIDEFIKKDGMQKLAEHIKKDKEKEHVRNKH